MRIPAARVDRARSGLFQSPRPRPFPTRVLHGPPFGVTRLAAGFGTPRHFDDSPQLPAGYATMILFAYVPPLWYRVMNPRVVAHYGGKMEQSNIKPSIRARVLARYSAAA